MMKKERMKAASEDDFNTKLNMKVEIHGAAES